MPEGRTKTRFTVAVDPGLAKALDRLVRGREITRSAAVEEALARWLRMMTEQDGEELDRISGGYGAGRGESAEAGMFAQMVLEALRHQFPAMNELGDDELRYRVLRKRGGFSGGA